MASTTDKYCETCGQKLTEEGAKKAADPDVTFCFNCGMTLDPKGKCQNDECDFFGRVPERA